jgi:hypothetical protein
MQRILPKVVVSALLLVAVGAAACNGDDSRYGNGDTRQQADEAATQVRESATEVRNEVRQVWASLVTDADRLVDRVQTRNDPEAKQELLERCRDTLEQMRRNDSPGTDRVSTLCDRIRDTDVNNESGWEEIKRRFNDLRDDFGS